MSLQTRLASLITAIGADIKQLQLQASTGLRDEFLTGNITSGQIGSLGWGKTGSGTSAFIAGVANHPGIFQLVTGTTLGTISAIHGGITANVGAFLGTELWDVTFIFRPTQIDTDTQIRIGVTASAGSATPTDGAYIEKLYADTNWFMVNRTGSAQTRTSMAIAAATGWHKVRVRRINSTTIGFTIDGGTEQTQNTNSPQLAVLPFVQITNQTVTSKSIDIDRFDMTISGLVR